MHTRIIKLLLGVIYLFTSSSFLHAGVMAHDMLEVENELQPCHDAAYSNQQEDTGDCFEQCMGFYDDFGGLTHLVFDDNGDIGFESISLYGNFPTDIIFFQFYAKTDPPPPTLVGYGCIGKNVEKLE